MTGVVPPTSTRQAPAGPRAGPAGATGTVAAAALATCVGAIPSFAVAANAGAIRLDLGLSTAELGAAIAAFGAASLVGVWQSGRLVEWFGARRSLVTATGVTLLTIAGFALLTRSGTMLGALLVVAGLANAFVQTSSNLTLATAAPGHRRGLSFGVKQAAVPSGLITAGFVVPLITERFGWRWSMLPLCLLAVAAMAVGLRTPTGRADRYRDRRRWRADGFVQTAAVAGFLASMVGSSLSGFFVDSLVVGGMPNGTAAGLLTVGGLCCVVSRLALGVLVDRLRVPPYLMAAAVLAVGSVGFVLLGLVHGSAALVAATVVAFGLGWGWPGLLLLASVEGQAFPARSSARVQTGTFAGLVAGPAGFGLVAQASSHATGWLLCAGLLLVAAGLVFVAGRRRPRPPQAEGA